MMLPSRQVDGDINETQNTTMNYPLIVMRAATSQRLRYDPTQCSDSMTRPLRLRRTPG